mmetsp:Transcript_26896/g.63463  ORF Transcript_26896/g.63463 Transcript_26896/m.63463 type:complete len:231 (+) Transcript_26896:564-1256(+)
MAVQAVERWREAHALIADRRGAKSSAKDRASSVGGAVWRQLCSCSTSARRASMWVEAPSNSNVLALSVALSMKLQHCSPLRRKSCSNCSWAAMASRVVVTCASASSNTSASRARTASKISLNLARSPSIARVSRRRACCCAFWSSDTARLAHAIRPFSPSTLERRAARCCSPASIANPYVCSGLAWSMMVQSRHTSSLHVSHHSLSSSRGWFRHITLRPRSAESPPSAFN